MAEAIFAGDHAAALREAERLAAANPSSARYKNVVRTLKAKMRDGS
jgi:hypothetical protein